MPDAATALLALWNDVDPLRDDDYNEWHAREHVPERLTVPGMLWALRYGRIESAAMPRYLTLYGLRDTNVLESAEYRRLLAEPTPASRAMRPALRHIARWVCKLQVEQGIARFQRLDVRTAAQVSATEPALPGAALLLAARIAGAADLPWLAGDQAQTVAGNHLEALAHDAGTPRWPDAVAYMQLPVG